MNTQKFANYCSVPEAVPHWLQKLSEIPSNLANPIISRKENPSFSTQKIIARKIIHLVYSTVSDLKGNVLPNYSKVMQKLLEAIFPQQISER